MGELREIIEAPTVERWFLILAILGPVLGLLIGAANGAKRSAVKSGAVSGVIVGLLGTLNWVLWRLYNVLTDANGLDTVKNVIINGVVFVVIGAVIGSVIGFMRRATPPMPESDSPALVGAGAGGPSRTPGAERSFDDSDAPPRDP